MHLHSDLLFTHLCILGMLLMPTDGFTCTGSSQWGVPGFCNAAYDNIKLTYWATSWKGSDGWISVQFNLVCSLAKLEIRHPFGGTDKRYNVKTIKLMFSEDGNTAPQYATLSPTAEPEWNVVTINPAVKTSSVKIEFNSVYDSSPFQTRGFSEIKFYKSSGNT